MSQTFFKFDPVQESLEDYFILHSGVSEQFKRAKHLVKEIREYQGLVFYVYGPKGCGKSHFIKVIKEKAQSLNVPSLDFELSNHSEIYQSGIDRVATDYVISAYQDFKSRGGLLLFESEFPPVEVTKDPHLKSRLLSGEIFPLEYPLEEELRPVLCSLLERYHLRLKDNHINQILNQVPAIPEYFELVSRSLNELVPVRGKIKKSEIKGIVEFKS